MSDEQGEKCCSQFLWGLGFFGVVVPVPQVTAMYANTNAYNFYSDTAIGNIPNIVFTTVGPFVIFLLLSMCAISEITTEARNKEREAAERAKRISRQTTTPTYTSNAYRVQTPKPVQQRTNNAERDRDYPTTVKEEDSLLTNIALATAVVALASSSHSRSRSPSSPKEDTYSPPDDNSQTTYVNDNYNDTSSYDTSNYSGGGGYDNSGGGGGGDGD